MVVMCNLLYGTAHAGLGAVWPDVRILFRGDSGVGKPALYERCEAFRVEYSIGIGMNSVLKKRSQTLLEGKRTANRILTARLF